MLKLNRVNYLPNIAITLKQENLPLHFRQRMAKKTDDIKNHINTSIQKVKSLVKPRGEYIIHKKVDSVVEDSQIPEPLTHADYIAFSITTIGSELEEKVAELMNEAKFSKAMIFDALGSAAVDDASAKIADIIYEKSKSEGLNTTRYFSPGGGSSPQHWDIKNQRYIFETLDAQKIGVQLTSSYLMIPKKSLSFIMGMGKNLEQAPALHSCKGCERTDCSYRYIPSSQD